ncbi:MAG TPA: hypothetical protein VLT56_05975, partial [Desulfobacterales bacterium]|nr:hypothetical protein [Desulfobacterales bacterium]
VNPSAGAAATPSRQDAAPAKENPRFQKKPIFPLPSLTDAFKLGKLAVFIGRQYYRPPLKPAAK